MAPIKIHFVGYHPETSVQARAVRIMEDHLKSYLGDEIDFRFDPDIGLLGGKAVDLLDKVETGEFDLCYFYSSYLTERVPELGLFELPFQISDRQSAYEMLDGDLGSVLGAAIKKNTGYRLLASWDNGIRHLSNGCHTIRTPADCNGLKIRTARNKIHQAAFSSMGFDPIFIDVKDLKTAAANGTIDAQENPLTNIVNYGLEDHHPYVTLTGHLFGISAVLANAKAYDAWPTKVRIAIEHALSHATAAQRKFAEEIDETCSLHLMSKGIEITELTNDEQASFSDAVNPIVQTARKLFDEDLLAVFDATRSSA
jgi:TRAP-type C4-dicarboxylate transport system substrate-binding protein